MREVEACDIQASHDGYIYCNMSNNKCVTVITYTTTNTHTHTYTYTIPSWARGRRRRRDGKGRRGGKLVKKNPKIIALISNTVMRG